MQDKAGNEAMRLLRKECQLRDILAAQVRDANHLVARAPSSLAHSQRCFISAIEARGTAVAGAGEDGGRA